ncbi:spidroin-1-like [Eucalyptus grandis]|uniref:spidroin-1-like n=1 Tax=Eucalyptus grandis TaxID=71139 RepID=UPI00192EF139|nr:spidroin-1-like [Eucalyptus grandis]
MEPPTGLGTAVKEPVVGLSVRLQLVLFRVFGHFSPILIIPPPIPTSSKTPVATYFSEKEKNKAGGSGKGSLQLGFRRGVSCGAPDLVGSGLRAAGIGGNEATRAKHGVTGRETSSAGRGEGGVGAASGRHSETGGRHRGRSRGFDAFRRGNGGSGPAAVGRGAAAEIVEQRCEETRSGDGWARASRARDSERRLKIGSWLPQGPRICRRGGLRLRRNAARPEGAAAASGKGSGVVSGAGSRLHEGKVAGRRGTDSCGSSL